LDWWRFQFFLRFRMIFENGGTRVIDVVEETNEFGGGHLTHLETNPGELADEVIAFRIEDEHGLIADIRKIKGWFLGGLGEGIEGTGGDAQFDGGERNDDVETFLENAVLFDQALDKLAVFDDRFFDFLRLDFLHSLVEQFDVFGNIFSLGADKNLDGEGEGIDEGGVGIDGGVLLLVGEQAEVDGGGLENESDAAILTKDQMILDGVNVEVFLGAGFDGTHFNFLRLRRNPEDCRLYLGFCHAILWQSCQKGQHSEHRPRWHRPD